MLEAALAKTTAEPGGVARPPVVVPLEPTGGLRVAVATRSMNDHLSRVSGDLVRLDALRERAPEKFERCCLRGTDGLGYFRDLLAIDSDWVVNLDEDAFVLDPQELVRLVGHMDLHGYAACGMPDGGVVRIRRHNPVACNAFFNVFDLRRLRPVWQYWERVVAARHRGEYEAGVAPFARRTPYAFDQFERYYGVFFSILQAGEKILYLDGEEWQDGVSTLLKSHAGKPLLVHCWYTRNWMTSYHTRERYRTAIEYARRAQGLNGRLVADPEDDDRTSPPTSNAGRWESRYRSLVSPHPYGETRTYEKAAQYLAGLATVEDWGCGCAWLKKYLPASVRYKGIDGTASPFADEVTDLATYRSDVEGVVLRHVLEHDPNWSRILGNAVASFRRRLVLVLFTPFAETTRPIAQNASLGVPDLSFAKADLVRHFAGLRWSLEENVATRTQYGVEHVFYVEKPETE
jgi:hypothetical protein